MTTNITNSDNVIDSRDIIDRIEELKALEPEEVTADTANELAALEALAAEGESSPDWEYGEMLIRDTYFQEYAQELAEDIGAIQHDVHWPNSCIDWEQAAWELQMDYFPVDFDGVDYWIRR